MNVSHGAEDPAHTESHVLDATGLRRLIDQRTSARRLLAALCIVLSGSCVDAVTAVSDGPIRRSVKVSQLSEAIAARYTAPERSGQFETARRRLVSGALVPSRAYNDTTIWSAIIPPSGRLLTAHGTLTDRGYRFEMSLDPLEMSKPGDTRHTIALRQLTESEYRWDTGVDFALGAVTAADVGAMMTQLLVSGADHDPTSIRAAAREAFPRSTVVLSRVFSVDSLTMRPGGQGSTVINMTVGVRPEGLHATAPHFADYLTKYVAKSRYRFTLADRNGTMFFEAIGADHLLTIRYRVKAGQMVSYLGPPRPMPDSLRLSNDFSIHVKMFEVGWKDLVTEFNIRRTEHSREWMVTARSEPSWQLPMITERVLRSPLRRPFQGAGATFEIGVFDSVGAQTVLARRTHLEVKESPILRFISGLVGRVYSDMDAGVEREEAEYVREAILAFQQDAARPIAR